MLLLSTKFLLALFWPFFGHNELIRALEKFRGFAFVTFVDSRKAEILISENPKFKGKKLQIKRAVAKGGTVRHQKSEKGAKLALYGNLSKLSKSR